MEPAARHDDTGNRQVVETCMSAYELINDPILNKGSAFTEDERDAFDLHGLLPPHVGTLDEQIERRMTAFHGMRDDLRRYVFLASLQDGNETLFHALLARNIEHMLPIVYTPTVGRACQEYSHIVRRPRGLFISFPHRHRIRQILAQPRFDQVQVIVVTDGERILGLGDQGAGGMGIPIGKLSLYTACAGVHPATTLPILLDAGTDNPERLADPLYLGWRHERVRGEAYDAFIDAFVTAVEERWPHVLLQWEDFALGNANRLLARYQDRLCTFNDDIQGTAAVTVGALLAAIEVTGVPLIEQRIAVFGAGSAGCGISALLRQAMVEAGLSEQEARSRFWLIDREGLLAQGGAGILPFQEPFAQERSRLADWPLARPDRIGLLDVVANARPTVLIGTSGQPATFTEEVVREMAKHVTRPIIFPLSNPTARSEAVPDDLLAWTGGRGVIGTGSPFRPVSWQGKRIRIDQTNNSYVFPGIGLGAIAARARRISDGMFMAAARALAGTAPARRGAGPNLLPPIRDIRETSLAVALAVARQAEAEGLAEATSEEASDAAIRARMWQPAYAPYRRVVAPR